MKESMTYILDASVPQLPLPVFIKAPCLGNNCVQGKNSLANSSWANLPAP